MESHPNDGCLLVQMMENSDQYPDHFAGTCWNLGDLQTPLCAAQVLLHKDIGRQNTDEAGASVTVRVVEGECRNGESGLIAES